MDTQHISSALMQQSAYLATLQGAAQPFAISPDRHLTAVSADLHGDLTLVVNGPALNLEKLLAVQTLLAQHLRVLAWEVSESRGSTGPWVAKARVQSLQARPLQDSTFENNTKQLRASITAVAEQQHLELALLQQAPSLAVPGLLVLDMDSTVIQVECIDEIAKLAGVGEEVAKVTELAMQGELDFGASLQQRVGCLAGTPEQVLSNIRHRLPLMPGVAHLIDTLHQHNWKVAIASGGFSYFANYLQRRLGLDAAVANSLEIIEGKLTGKISGTLVDAKHKATVLQQLASQFDIALTQTVAMGDGANDLAMMQVAQLGVAYHAKAIVSAQAQASIRFAGVDSLLDYLA